MFPEKVGKQLSDFQNYDKITCLEISLLSHCKAFILLSFLRGETVHVNFW